LNSESRKTLEGIQQLVDHQKEKRLVMNEGHIILPNSMIKAIGNASRVAFF
jgi:hypothetical protein